MKEKPKIRVDDDGVVVHIRMKFKRRGGRKEIIMPDSDLTACGGKPTAFSSPLRIRFYRS